MSLKYIFGVLLALLFPICSLADGGMMMWPPDVNLNQSAQNAIVGWNGSEEVLILSNDIESNATSTALRIVPLPSEPKVEQGSLDSFKKMQQILNEKYAQMREANWGPGMDKGPKSGQGVEIAFEKKIGAHDLTAVNVENVNDFVEWIENFTQKESLPDKEISKEFESAIDNYLKRDINYFVFDVIIVKEEKSIKPLVYEFNSSSLYYPLLMTSASELTAVNTSVNLFTVTGGSSELPSNYSWSGYSPVVKFSQGEISQVSKKIADLFSGETKVKEISINRSLDQIDEDFSLYPYSWDKNLSVGDQGEQVKALQKILINEGVWNSDVKATGYFGPVTKQAVKRYQEMNKRSILQSIGLSEGTGFFGPKTRGHLRKYSVEGVQPKITGGNKPQSCQGITFNRSLKRGMKGQDVKCLQAMLNHELKEPLTESGPGSPGNETSYFGPLTESAVVRFQEKYQQEILAPFGLVQGTGYFGKETRSKARKQLQELDWQQEQPEDLTYCETDEDCTLVKMNCCPCSSGGSMKCINKKHEQQWTKDLNCVEKVKEGLACPEVYLCPFPSGCKCVDNTCQTVK